jgi:hypothetical protein
MLIPPIPKLFRTYPDPFFPPVAFQTVAFAPVGAYPSAAGSCLLPLQVCRDNR